MMRHLLAIVCFALSLPALGQAPAEVPVAESSNTTTLRALVESITSLRAQLQTQVERNKGTSPTDAAKQELASLEARLAQAQRDFDSIATGVDDRGLTATPVGKFDLSAELSELLMPFMQEVKQVTSQPREIERLRGEVDLQARQLDQAKRAVTGLEATIKSLPSAAADTSLRKALQDTLRKWEVRVTEATSTLEVTRLRLSKALAERKTLWQIVTQGAKGFFLTRGLNLILALLTFAAAFIGWRAMHRQVVRYSPWHRPGGQRPFLARLLDVIYHALAVVVGILAALTILYATGDWLLLGLSLIAIIALVLAAKNGLPRYYTQARLMLNLGEVREGERLVYQGLPWQVKSLNMSAELHNPALRHPTLRIPFTQLQGLSSRPSSPGEPWFPCAEGDWVQLADATFGKVVSITTEFVQLVQHGGAHKTYPTLHFLQQHPVNLAGGFRVTAIVKVHPTHRELATKEIPEKMQAAILGGLLGMIDADHLKGVRVEFRAIIPRAMEFDVVADFTSQVADKLPSLQRALQHHALATCNAQGWRLGG